jgi:hypothetical protein
VLFVYFTYTNQTTKVLDVMAEELRGRGCAVTMACLEFIDPRYDESFKTFPMPPVSGGARHDPRRAEPEAGEDLAFRAPSPPNDTTWWYSAH